MYDWRSHAACRGLGPALFYAESHDEHLVTVARTVCAACPVADACLADALDRNELYGVWGGTSPRQRQRLRRVGDPIWWDEYVAQLREPMAASA